MADWPTRDAVVTVPAVVGARVRVQALATHLLHVVVLAHAGAHDLARVEGVVHVAGAHLLVAEGLARDVASCR